MMTRRKLLKSAALGIIILWFNGRVSASESSSRKNQQISFQWRVPKAHFETVKKELEFDGEISTENDTKGVPFIFIFAGIALIPYLAKAVLALRRDLVYGGVVIDTRGKQIVIDTDKSIHSGVIVVISKNGTQLYERDEIGGPAELVSALSKGL